MTGGGNMKRRVQAQRKFAQGAFIPPSHSSAAPAKSSDAPTPIKADRSIIHSNLSAKSLLDIVSLQSMHTHSGPVVLIKRMAPEILAPNINGHESEVIQKIQPKEPSPILSFPSPSTKRRTFKIQKHRQRHNANNRLRPSKQLIKRVPERTTTDYSASEEDDRPLKYFKITKETVPEARTPKKRPPIVDSSDSSATSGDRVTTRLSTALQEKGQTPPADNRKKKTPKKSTTTESPKKKEPPASIEPETPSKTFKDPAIPARFTRTSDERKKKTPKKSTTTESPKEKEPPASKEPETPSKTFKEPAIPARFTRTSGQKKRAINSRKEAENQNKGQNDGAVASTSKDQGIRSSRAENQNKGQNDGAVASTSKDQGIRSSRAAKFRRPISPDAMVAIPGPSNYQFYNNSNIERWMNGNDLTRMFTSEESRRNDKVCPSETLRTASDVRNASPATLARRCLVCKACYRVNIVMQISGLMSSSRQSSARDSDVYEFDANDDATNPPPVYSHRNRNVRSQDGDKSQENQTPSEETTETRRNDDPAPVEQQQGGKSIMYLDINKDSPSIIEMTLMSVPNCQKKMMKARIIPRSQAQPIEDVQLVEHENLLDQLLKTLSVNNEAIGIDSDMISTIHNDKSAERMRYSGKRPWATDPTEEQIRIPKIRPEAEKKTPKLVEAPTFYPTAEEFADPIAYFEKIAPQGARYGLCKVKLPDDFQPQCYLNDEFKFNVANHYVARMYSRWGPAAREICAMRAYLATQNVHFNRVPLLDSIEVNLPKLYSVVQRQGGLEQVLDNRRWSKVAEEMCIKKGPNTEKILDGFYVKYLVPFDTASNQERGTILSAVERCWLKKHRKLVEWASNPLHQQKKLMGESDSSEDESSPKDEWLANKALYEAEDCVVTGRPMHLSGFKKVATNAMAMYMKNKLQPSVEDVESEYWRLALFGTEHVCVNAASIDTATAGYGFSTNRNDPCSKHPWNLKMLTLNSSNVLRSINTVLGVTIPTLHLGMVFSTCCWHRDPHGLPWTEYMHSGPPKIWYGIPEDQSSNFRKAVETLCPTSCQNKYIWLSSDITMIPPNLLLEHNVSLSHTLQNPGEFIIVFPHSYSCSISTGFTVSESVYFAPFSWLQTVHQIYQVLRSSCEPTAFALEHLLFALAKDPRSSLSILHTVHSSLKTIVDEELRHRKALAARGLPMHVRSSKRRRTGPVYSTQDEAECKICRTTLYMSKVIGLLGKKIYFCPMHAIRMLETHKYTEAEIAKTEVVLYYSDKQLEDIMSNLAKRLFPSRESKQDSSL